MTKIAIVEDEKCSICEKENTELLEIVKDGIFTDTHIFVCQSCVSKWFKSFQKKK